MKRTVFYVLVCICLCAVSCTKEDRKATIIQQESSIDSYIGSLVKDTVVYRDGVVRAIIEQGVKKDTAAVGDSVYFFYAGYIFTNGKGKLFYTNSDSVATANNVSLASTEAVLRNTKLGNGDLIEGLERGLVGMRQNEHAYIVFNADYGYGNSRVGQVPAMSALLFEVWLEQIRKN